MKRVRLALALLSLAAAGIAAPFAISAYYDRIDHPPRGRDGGRDGAAGYVGLKSGRKLKGKGFQEIPTGDRLVVMTPGGAGIGAPAERELRLKESDLAEGLVSGENGAAAYGALDKASM